MILKAGEMIIGKMKGEDVIIIKSFDIYDSKDKYLRKARINDNLLNLLIKILNTSLLIHARKTLRNYIILQTKIRWSLI